MRRPGVSQGENAVERHLKFVVPEKAGTQDEPPTMIILYGIANCDTVKKARTWLDTSGHAYTFHDFKKAGLDETTVARWLQRQPWETLVNKKGTTWRGLPDAQKTAVTDAASATVLMMQNTSVIKRPVLCKDDQVLVGFDPILYQQALQA